MIVIEMNDGKVIKLVKASTMDYQSTVSSLDS